MISIFITTVVFLLLLQNMITLLPLPGIHSLDEIITALVFVVGVGLQVVERQSISRVTIATLGLCCYLILISVAYGQNRNIFDIVVQSYISTKFFFLAAGMYSLSICRTIRYGKLMAWLVGITFVGIVLQGIIGNEMFSVLHIIPKKTAGLEGLTRFSGFQLNANAAGVALALGTVCLFSQLREYDRSTKSIYLAIGVLTLGILLTGSRSALAFELLGMIFTFRFRKAVPQILFVSLAVALIVLTQSDIFLLFYQKTIANLGAVESGGTANYPRWIMAYYGSQLAWSHFPIGTGAATFGSVLSAGSQIYGELGLLVFNSIAGGGGIYDSNFGSIAGEYGFIGIVLFYGLLIYVVHRFSRKANLKFAWLGLSRIAWLFILLGIGATFLRPLFSSSYYGSLFILTLILSAQQSRLHSDEIRRSGNMNPELSVPY